MFGVNWFGAPYWGRGPLDGVVVPPTPIDFCETTVRSLMRKRRVRSLMPNRSARSLMPNRRTKESCQ
jgi:hypothetical protein